MKKTLSAVLILLILFAVGCTKKPQNSVIIEQGNNESDIAADTEQDSIYSPYAILEINNITNETKMLRQTSQSSDFSYTKLECSTVYFYDRFLDINEIYVLSESIEDLCEKDVILIEVAKMNRDGVIYYGPITCADHAEYIKIIDGKLFVDENSLDKTVSFKPIFEINALNNTNRKFYNGMTLNDLILWFKELKNIRELNGSKITKTYVYSPLKNRDGDDYFNTEFCAKYISEFYGLHDFVAELVNETDLSNWMKQFDSEERSRWDLTILSVVQELSIPQEQLTKANNNAGKLFSDEQISSLYSGDIKKVNQCFANPYALVVDGEIYTPDWLATHTLSNYQRKGITFDILEKYIEIIDIPELDFVCVPIALAMKELNKSFDVFSVEQVTRIEYHPSIYFMPDKIHSYFSDEEYEKWVSSFLVEGNTKVRDFSEFNIVNILAEHEEKQIDSKEIFLDRLPYLLKESMFSKDAERIRKDFRLDTFKSFDYVLTVEEKDAVRSYMDGYSKYVQYANKVEIEPLGEEEFFSTEEYNAIVLFEYVIEGIS